MSGTNTGHDSTRRCSHELLEFLPPGQVPMPTWPCSRHAYPVLTCRLVPTATKIACEVAPGVRGDPGIPLFIGFRRGADGGW
eukprot:216298-Rhodomonas_salina.2